MASKKRTVSQPLELTNTLIVAEQEYNINAVYSDKAGHVENSLKIYEQKDTNKPVPVEYNGSEEKSITYVPASGGAFTGPVTIQNNNIGLTTNSIINLGQMETKLKSLTGFPVYEWDGSKLTGVNLTNTSELAKLNIILGTKDDFDKLLNNNSVRPEIFIYIFINSGTETGTMYLKIKDTVEIRLASTARYLLDDNGSQFKIDQIISEISMLSNNLADCANTLHERIDEIYHSLDTGLDRLRDRLDEHMDDIASGEEVVGRAVEADHASNATTANTATKAQKDEDDIRITTNYYRSGTYRDTVSTIYIGNVTPQDSSGINGDIYIVHS